MDITGIGSILDIGGKIIDRIWPDPTQRDAAKLELFKAQQAGMFKEMDAQIEVAKAQIAVNAVEAASPSIFVSGPRPFIMWICATALAWNYIVRPALEAGMAISGHPTPIPAADMGELMPLLIGMLGLGTMRTIEKLKGVASK